jgi:hypothetical protein
MKTPTKQQISTIKKLLIAFKNEYDLGNMSNVFTVVNIWAECKGLLPFVPENNKQSIANFFSENSNRAMKTAMYNLLVLFLIDKGYIKEVGDE